MPFNFFIKSTLIVSVVIYPLPKTVAEIKIDAVSRKFCLFSHGIFLFLVSLTPFE